MSLNRNQESQFLNYYLYHFFKHLQTIPKNKPSPHRFFSSTTINRQFDGECQNNKDDKKPVSSTFTSFANQQVASQNRINRRFSDRSSHKKTNPLATLQGVHTQRSSALV